MKKALFVILIGLLLVGAAFSQGILFTGEASAEDDKKEGGGSWATVTEGTRDGVTSWRLQGQMLPGITYPYINITFTPDEATKERLKNATTISFKVLGDGTTYRMEYRTELVKDWGFHAANFKTVKGQVTQVSLKNRTFQQPGWAAMVRLRPERATGLAIIPDDSARDERQLDITVWDLRLE